MRIQDVFANFDIIDKKCFSFHELVSAINALGKDETKKPEHQYEYVAFSLQPQHGENPWGNYYFGPYLTGTDNEGNIVYIPSRDQITPNAVLYWEKRYKEVINPLLKMRYAALVWDYKKTIVHDNYEPNLYRILVDSMLEVCNGDYQCHPALTINVLERLFDIAKGQPQDLLLVKQAYANFEIRHAEDKNVRYWASRFEMMLKYKNSFTQKEKEDIVAEHEARLERLNTPDENDRVSPWNIQAQVSLLADYYNSCSQKDDIMRLLQILEQAFYKEKIHMTRLQFIGNLERVLKLYRHYNLSDEVNRVLLNIQQLSIGTTSELESVVYELETPQEFFELADRMFGKKATTDEERLNNFAGYFLPKKAKEEESLKKIAEEAPLQSIFKTQLKDEKGRPTSVVGPIEEDLEGNLAYYIAEKLSLQGGFLRVAIDKLFAAGISMEKIMNNVIVISPIFDEERYAIIREALDFLVEGRYILFSHLIVPQIEHTVCNLVEMAGGSILRLQMHGKGFQLKTLDELLRERKAIDILTEDGAYYLRLVLTHQIGLNIRNLMCHGILPAEHFGKETAMRLFHVLIFLGLCQKEK
ncbi:MAG: DUF4209 domain-containing protein [Bacteroides sp.]|nr:DUF4209 domain-containing protein [Ruminococcus flavefaciens]MCM1554681.1 DUF4209 domain-containing protein [Bacteroides sp.]